MAELKQLLNQYFDGKITLADLTEVLDEKLKSDPELVRNISDIQEKLNTNNDEQTILNNELTRVMTRYQEETVIMDRDATDVNQAAAIERKIAEFDASRQRTLKPGDVLKDRFILESVIGRGGMSVVFKARDKRKEEAHDSNPHVAMKVLGNEFKEHPESFIVLQRETQKAQKLAHPNIVTVYDFDRDGDTIYMTMECLYGKSLDQIIREHPAGMSPEKAYPIVDGMAQALAYAHKKDIIHSDFKPGNVFVTDDGAVKVLDFGIARAKNASGDFDAGDLGALTPAYASYEMFAGDAPDPADDIYALACMTYELLCGRHPYNRTPADKAYEQKLDPKRVTTISPRRWQALRQGLALKRDMRTPTIEKFLHGVYPSKLSKGLKIAFAAIVVMTITASYFYYKAEQAPELPVIELTVEQQQKISDYLETAELYIELGQLATPPGDSAFDLYDSVLSVDPTNQTAIEGKEKIAERYYELAQDAVENNNKTKAKEYINTGLQVQSSHSGLLDLKKQLTK